MYRKEVPKLNKENFLAWKRLMKLHLGELGYYVQETITTEYVVVTRAPTIEQLKQKKEHNRAMLEIAYALSYLEFEDIKTCTTSKGMWDALQKIYGGDKNVLRAKAKSLRGNFDDMKMQEGKTLVQYCGRIKDVVMQLEDLMEILNMRL